MEKTDPKYGELEQIIRDALNALNSVCDGAIEKDGTGFKSCHVNSFTQSLIHREEPYTSNQLTKAFGIVNQYQAQLKRFGIVLPKSSVVYGEANKRQQSFERQKILAAEGGRMVVKYHHDYFWVTFPTFDNPHFQKFKKKCIEMQGKNYPGFTTLPEWTNDERLGWKIPRSYQMISMFKRMFPHAQYNTDEITQKALKIIEQEIKDARLNAARKEAERIKEMNSLLQAVGDLDGEIAPGITLFNHQKEDVKFACYRKRYINANDMGLGKTVSAGVGAMAYAKKYNLHVVVITKKNVKKVWQRWAERLGMKISTYTWQKIPYPNEQWPDYFLIGDESHMMQNWKSQRTQNMVALALHEKCKGLIHCTGTPAPNGRPKELYPMLYSCKFPLVWSDNPDPELKEKEDKFLKRRFEERYCNGHLEEIMGKKVWDIKGASNLEELNKLLRYRPGRNDNHEWSLMIHRKSEECLDLPKATRIMYEAEISDEARAMIAKMLDDAVVQFETNKEANLEQYRITRLEELQANEKLLLEAGETIEESAEQILEREYKDKETLTENARTLALQTAYRMASALAKVDSTVALAIDLLNQNEKVVIFTMFRQSAEQIKKRLEEEAKVVVGTVLGGQEETNTNAMIDDFQSKNGKTKVMICSLAGAEGITLTAARYLLMNDRAWRPGDNFQAEKRIHRIDSEFPCFFYWSQIPASICETDTWIDGLLLSKDSDINMIMQGKSENSLKFMHASINMIKADAKRNAKQLEQVA